MSRVFWLILDSVGIGGAPDAAEYGDEGADTLGHIAEWFLEKKGRALSLPVMEGMGLGEAYRVVHGVYPAGWDGVGVSGCYAAATEVSKGKDTPSGHWELAGVPVTWDWGYFPKVAEGVSCFPPELLEAIDERCGLGGALGLCHASGTEIISRFGAQSVETGRPIFYTSADSVFQIAAHEEAFGLERLYEVCEAVRELTREAMVGRVIARPFLGEAGEYIRTANRKDYALTPPRATVLQRVVEGGGEVYGVGKIGDIFAHTGMTEELKASGHEALWERTREARDRAAGRAVVMTNFVDFDMLYGHRRDPEGYGLALEEWDGELGLFLAEMSEGDLVVITADHGNDPTWEGTDHTRERVPVLLSGGLSHGVNAGIRDTFSDVGATIGEWFGIEMEAGVSILGDTAS